ncbi:antibiotic biosynthesis monooxygenase [Microbacterium sp. Sa4CUA7]|uniref:Antibiotic biosynthesis monooxygenase n=1 Tax=Microbacterium pullorum TaxID=2762236 RepID=A0ABR8RZ88_9MICO|nr:antibiotic biosynthesis monooxygenase [Microbacterium pullorum]MBD7956404.1 antibiotic biosynthesis monooxygenase [Microbacterium pullorum]
MPDVTLTGQLLCRSADEDALVREHLPRHVALTRAEPGCLAFDVAPTGEPGVWDVAERFRDETSFRAHQERVAASEWGAHTAGIERRYTVRGLDAASAGAAEPQE